MNALQKYTQSKERKKRLDADIHYRQEMCRVNQNVGKLQKLYDQYVQQAKDAEKAGEHQRAVQLACEAAKLKKYQLFTGSTKGTLEMAHTLNDTNRALFDAMKNTGAVADSLMDSTSAGDIISMQTNMEMIRQEMNAFMEQNELMFEADEQCMDSSLQEIGEQYLKQLMAREKNTKKKSILDLTNQHLDKKEHNRKAENERSKI